MAGVWGVLTILVALYPKTEPSALVLMALLFIGVCVVLPINYAITWWKVDKKGVRSNGILNTAFIPASEIRSVVWSDEKTLNSRTSFIINGNGRRIIVPFWGSRSAEFCEFIMREYSENIWGEAKEDMMRCIEMRNKLGHRDATRT